MIDRDPDRAREWERRSRERARTSGWQSPERIRSRGSGFATRGAPPARSAKTRAQAPEHARIRDLVFRRDGRCLLVDVDGHQCGGVRLTPHHLLKASQGGEYSVGNLVTLCAAGNTWVEDHPAAAFQLGLVVGWDRTAGERVDHDEASRRRRLHGLTP